MAIRKYRSAGKTLMGFAALFNIGAQIAAGYVGAQSRAQVERLKAENMALKNQISAQQVGKLHNDVLLGDLTIEKRILEIEVLKKKLGLDTAPFTATDYDEPGNIRQAERNRRA